MNTSEKITNIAAAMIEVEKQIKGMTPDAKNPFFKSNYITLDGILEYARPILAKQGVWIFQNASGDGEFVNVTTRLVHSSGEFIETDDLKMKPQKNDPQQLGSCITYAKRYQLASLLGISSEVDDDGNKATFGNNNTPKPPKKAPTTPPPQAEGNNTTLISETQRKRLFEVGKGNAELVKEVLAEYKYTSSKDIKKSEYEAICAEIEARKI